MGVALGQQHRGLGQRYLPLVARTAIATSTLSPWGGFALFCAYAALAVAAGAVSMIRRDA